MKSIREKQILKYFLKSQTHRKRVERWLQWAVGGGNRLVKRYQPSVVWWIMSEDLVGTMVTILTTTTEIYWVSRILSVVTFTCPHERQIPEVMQVS